MMNSAQQAWDQVSVELVAQSGTLCQGDVLSKCIVPVFAANLELALETSDGIKARCDQYDLIVVTQSCDLCSKQPPELVAVCPVFSIESVQKSTTPSKTNKQWKSHWENVRKGRVPSQHLIPNATEDGPWLSSIVDFTKLFTLPYAYLVKKAEQTPRYRLRSPYLEHFSQAFARFFMRVGLPVDIPTFESAGDPPWDGT